MMDGDFKEEAFVLEDISDNNRKDVFLIDTFIWMIDQGMSAKHLCYPTCCVSIKRCNEVYVLILISTTIIMIVRYTDEIIKPKMSNSHKIRKGVAFDINNNNADRTKSEWWACCTVYNTQVIRQPRWSQHVYHTQKSVNNVVRSRCACCMVYNTQVIRLSHWNRHAIIASLSFDNGTIPYIENPHGVIGIDVLVVWYIILK